MGQNIILKNSPLQVIRTVNDKLMSYNVEFTEVTGGTFWKAYTPEQIAGTEKFSVGDAKDIVTAMSNLMQVYPPIDLYNEKLRKLAKELGPSNIRVNSIAPGIIKTDMNSNLSNEELKYIEEQIPLERIGYPQSITKCVKWLIDDDYTTGQIISINGGWNIN